MISSIMIGIGLEGAVAIVALKWAILKSDVAFFSVFVGDALVKLTGLGLFTWWLWSKHLPFTVPLLTIGLGYLLVSLIQIPFLYKAR